MHRARILRRGLSILLSCASLIGCTEARPASTSQTPRIIQTAPPESLAMSEPATTQAAAMRLVGGAALVVGQQLVTVVPDVDLWAEPQGTRRVMERPRLYEGTVITVLTIEPDALEVRTHDDVTGWLRDAAPALSDDLVQPGERERFVLGQRVQVVWANGIPLRAEPRSTATRLRLDVAAGTPARVEELRGDWLRVTLDDGMTGWLRWYYDGRIYVDALGN